MTKPDNLYLREISEKTGTISDKHRPNNWYLKYIAENIGGGSDLDYISVVITYEDTTTETVQIAVKKEDD